MKNSKFKALVDEVKEQKLSPVQEITDKEAAIDAYINEHKLAYVLDEGKFYFRYKNTLWIRASWFKLRRDCPIVFNSAETYLLLQQTVMSRLKKMGRVYRTAVIDDVHFE